MSFLRHCRDIEVTYMLWIKLVVCSLLSIRNNWTFLLSEVSLAEQIFLKEVSHFWQKFRMNAVPYHQPLLASGILGDSFFMLSQSMHLTERWTDRHDLNHQKYTCTVWCGRNEIRDANLDCIDISQHHRVHRTTWFCTVVRSIVQRRPEICSVDVTKSSIVCDKRTNSFDVNLSRNPSCRTHAATSVEQIISLLYNSNI